MKVLSMLLVALMMQVVFSQAAVYAETIYTKDGEAIEGVITEVEEGVVWIETTQGDISEEIGIDLVDIEKILNDDESVSEYSPSEQTSE